MIDPDTPIADWEFSVRTSNALKNAGITTFSGLMALTKDDVMSIKNAGRRTWNEIHDVQLAYSYDAEEAFNDLVAAVHRVNAAMRDIREHHTFFVEENRVRLNRRII